MSNLLPSSEAEECVALRTNCSTLEPLQKRTTTVGALNVQRLLPVRGRRLIGPWCFLDLYGPLSFGDGKPMDVAPHPHIGLQTVSWLIEGEIVHNDSLGNECLVRPGHLSLMTAGRGIAHAEETPAKNSKRLNGLQLWVALPNDVRAGLPSYQCTGQLQTVEQPGGLVTAVVGQLGGSQSPGEMYSPAVGADLTVHKQSRTLIPLEPAFDHGIVLLHGDAIVEGFRLEPGTLYYAGTNRNCLEIESTEGARLFLIGGAPFGETIVMWWNFVARSFDEIAQARRAWEAHEGFGEVTRYQGLRLAAPEFIGRVGPSTT